MQLVDERWYQWYRRLATSFAGLLAIGSLFALFVPLQIASQLGEALGLNYITLVVSLATAAYGLFWFPRQAEAMGASQALILLTSIQSVNAVNLLHSTGMTESWYLILWGVILFLAGMFGPFAIAGVFFVLSMYFVLFSRNMQGEIVFSLHGAIGFVSLLAISIISYYFWRPKYQNSDNVVIKKLTGQLKSKQQQAEILIETISDGILLIDSEGKIGLMNKAAADMTEWAIEEGTGIDVRLVTKFAKEDSKDLETTEDPFVEAISKQEPISKILQLTGRGGKTQIVSIVVTPVVKDNAMIGAVAVLRDISAERAEEHRRADFISTASHEMRTPVAAIEGYLALALNEKVSKIDSKARDFLEKAHSSTQHLGKLFQDLLTSAKAEDGRLVSHPTVVELGAYMDQLVDSLRFAADKKGLLMDLTFGSSSDTLGGNKVVRPLYYVHVDPDRLREVITNIFDNAVKYTPNGKVSVGLTGNNDVVQIYIKDTGPGIPAEDVPHLFQKFYRVDNSSTRTVGGTGLGLFICKKIIELYHGRIWAESEVGKGSTFYMNLPRLSSDKAAELQKLEAQNQGVAPVTSLTTPVV